MWQDKNRVRVILLGLQVLPIQVQVYAMVVLTLEIHMVRCLNIKNRKVRRTSPLDQAGRQ